MGVKGKAFFTEGNEGNEERGRNFVSFVTFCAKDWVGSWGLMNQSMGVIAKFRKGIFTGGNGGNREMAWAPWSPLPPVKCLGMDEFQGWRTEEAFPQKVTKGTKRGLGTSFASLPSVKRLGSVQGDEGKGIFTGANGGNREMVWAPLSPLPPVKCLGMDEFQGWRTGEAFPQKVTKGTKRGLGTSFASLPSVQRFGWS